MMIRQTRLARSLLDRVFGGVCGGLSAYLDIPSWWLRLFLLLVTVLTAGVAVLLYLILWWTLPVDLEPGTPTNGRDIGLLLLVGAATVVTGLIAIARGMGVLAGPDGSDLFWPAVAVFLGVALFLRALRRS
ncbi:PspC domain-containing protein [Chloroflexota bacterium]